MISAKVVGDSVNPYGQRITSMELVYPRYIHSEFMTHRMLSKNSASSRAIPFNKMISTIKANPFVPIAWQKDHKGMQGKEYYTQSDDIIACEDRWLRAMDRAIRAAEGLNSHNVTKQLCNRLVEPFMWHKVLVTGTEWENFFQLRCPVYVHEYAAGVEYRSWKDLTNGLHELGNATHHMWYYEKEEKLKQYSILERLKYSESGAEIHIQLLAEAMWDAMNESKPRQLEAGEWHIPYFDKISFGNDIFTKVNDANEQTDVLLRISTGMAARASYTTIGDEKEVSYERLIKIHDDMKIAVPFHASPFEHCSQVPTKEEYYFYSDTKFVKDDDSEWHNQPGWYDNFRGFKSYRRILKEQM